MGAKKTVNLKNLEGLGARRLAEILLELGEQNAEIKRRLRFELAGESGAEVIAADITKRLAALRRARSFIDWQKRRSFVKDIDLQREMITTKVAEARPDLALDLMWRFRALSSNGTENRHKAAHASSIPAVRGSRRGRNSPRATVSGRVKA